MARVVSGVWMGLAHTVGGAARALGRNARDLDPAHRRDGVGLACLGLAIIAASVTWWHMANVVGRGLSAVLRGGFGSAAWVLPILLALLGWRYLRHPDRNADNARMAIGWTALIVGGLGLVHIAHGTPRPSDGVGAIRAAGGVIGYAASAPLVAAVTPWVAVPLLALLAGVRPARGHRHAAAPGATRARRSARLPVGRPPARTGPPGTRRTGRAAPAVS